MTSSHIAHNPRLVKEADVLKQAGYDVRVVSSQVAPWIALNDYELMETRGWVHDPVKCIPVNFSGRYLYWCSYFRMHIFRDMFAHVTFKNGFAERAYCRLYSKLLRHACRQPADLFIAHNLDALPVAYTAARRFDAKLGFDSEDFHSGEFHESAHHTVIYRLVEYIESKYLPACDYVSAPSALVADALVKRYGIDQPIVAHNVFPWADRKSLDGQVKDRHGPALSLYWYGQTIGLDRGIQDAILAAGLLSKPVQIHLRGMVSEKVKSELLNLARDNHVAKCLYFHHPVPPTELLSRAAEHDIGLALEQPVNQSRQLSVTNKLFLYLLAGLSVAATDVPGQRYIMSTRPDAGLLYQPGGYKTLAAQIKFWIANSDGLDSCKRAALEAARDRWNWEVESKVLLDKIRDLLKC